MNISPSQRDVLMILKRAGRRGCPAGRFNPATVKWLRRRRFVVTGGERAGYIRISAAGKAAL